MEFKNEILAIFGRSTDAGTNSADDLERQNLSGDSLTLNYLQASRSAGLNSISPNHTAPTEKDRFSIALLLLALFYLKNDVKEDVALVALKQALSLNPFLAEAHYKLASYHMFNKAPDAALEQLEKTIQLSPRYVPAYTDAAAILMMMKNYTKAIGYLQKALDIDSRSLTALYNKSICHQSLEHWKDAIEAYERILEIYESERSFGEHEGAIATLSTVQIPNVVHALANCYSRAANAHPTPDNLPRQHFFQKSRALLEHYVGREHKDERAWCVLGCVHLELNSVSAAKEAFLNALEANPDSLDAHANLGIILFRLGDNDRALVHLEHALQLDDSLFQLHMNAGHVYRLRSDSEKAIEHYKKALEINPTAASECHVFLGVLLLNSPKTPESSASIYEQAKMHLDEGLKSFPQSIDVHYHLARFFQLFHNEVAARSHFDMAYRLTISSLSSNLQMCFKLLDDGNYAAFNKALDRELTDAANLRSTTPQGTSTEANSSYIQMVAINAASLLKETGRLADAIRVCQAVLVAAPRYLPAHLSLARLHERVGSYDKAIEHLRLIVEIDPKQFDPQFQLGNLMAAQGNFNAAVPHLLAAVELNRFHSVAWHTLADCQVELGQYRSAQASYNHVVRLDPQEADAYLGIGVCLHHLQQYRDAEAAYSQAITLSKGTNHLAFYNLSSTLVALGKPADAMAALRKALQLEPEFAHAHLDLALLLLDGSAAPSEEAKNHLNTAIQLDASLLDRVPKDRRKLLTNP